MLRSLSRRGSTLASSAPPYTPVTVRAGATRVTLPRAKIEASFTRSSGAVRGVCARSRCGGGKGGVGWGVEVILVSSTSLSAHFPSPSPRTLQGGQNVNKVNTKAQLRLPLSSADWLDEHTRARLRSLFASSVTRDDALLVTSQQHRTQAANLEDAMRKLHDMVLAAAQVPAQRDLRAELTAHAKAVRTLEKRRRGEVKARRGGGGGGDD